MDNSQLFMDCQLGQQSVVYGLSVGSQLFMDLHDLPT